MRNSHLKTEPRVGPEENGRGMSVLMAKHIVVVVMCLVLWSASSCATRAHLVLHRSETLTVMLPGLPSGYPALAPFRYAHVIEPKDTFALLESLTYEGGSLLPLTRGPRHRVFTRHQADVLAPELSKALNLALPHEVAAFSVSDEEKPTRPTRGLAFVHRDELHLILEELHPPWDEGEQKSFQQQGSRWSLLLGDGQRHYASHPGGTGAMTNWIIVPLR